MFKALAAVVLPYPEPALEQFPECLIQSAHRRGQRPYSSKTMLQLGAYGLLLAGGRMPRNMLCERVLRCQSGRGTPDHTISWPHFGRAAVLTTYGCKFQINVQQRDN